MTFTQPIEFAVLRGKLEAEGIECRILDELTVQVNPFYSNAIGGIKLQVRESDIQKAIEILKDGGYIKDKDLQSLPKNLSKFDKATSEVPFLKNLRVELRLMIIIAFVLLFLGGILYLTSLISNLND